jgi:LAS superfamily LD-carboxypeptidase LdcB
MIVQGYAKGSPFDLEVEAIDEHGHMLRADAAFDYRRMAAAALAEAGIILHVNRAWSSFAKQKEMRRIYEWQLAEHKAGRRKKKAVYASPPGWSKHQDGTAVDINRAHDDFTDNGIADGKTDTMAQGQRASVRVHQRRVR